MKHLVKELSSMCLGEMASILYRNFQVFVSSEMKAYEVNFSEYIYLIKIQDKEEVNQKYLADITSTDNALVTRSIQSLEKKKFIIRRKSNEDKRAHLVSLTGEGQKIADICRDLRKKWGELILARLNDQEKKNLFNYINKITWDALKVNNPNISES